jgi:hypothetical protein
MHLALAILWLSMHSVKSLPSAWDCHENIQFHEKRNVLSSALETLPGNVFGFKGGPAEALATLRAFAQCTKPFVVNELLHLIYFQ